MILRRFFCLLPLLWASLAPAQTRRDLRDMAGDTVQVPAHIERVATVGAVPVLNSLLFAIGEGGRIVNGLPTFAKKPRWGYQMVFAPHTASLPSLQNPDHSPQVEALMQVAPDVVLTMDRSAAETLNRLGLPALYLAWRKPEDVKAVVRLLGDLLDQPKAAQRYVLRFDDIIGRVGAAIEREGGKRPTVLYFSPSTLRQPHLVAEWWIKAAGGNSVTDDGRQAETRSFTMEQLLDWDPDFLIVSDLGEAKTVLHDPRFAALKAVRTGQVLVTPCGAHTWGNRTSEQPLTVLWAASQFHPRAVPARQVQQETQRFYRELFAIDLSAAQVGEILTGGPRVLPADR